MNIYELTNCVTGEVLRSNDLNVIETAVQAIPVMEYWEITKDGEMFDWHVGIQ